MMKFRQFLKEAPWVNPDVDKTVEPAYIDDSDKRTQISKMKSGHIIKERQLPNTPSTEREFSIHTPDDKHIIMSVSGTKQGNIFKVSSLQGTTNKTIKAHEFYHHLITQHDLHIHSDYEQSEGGMKVWKKLHQMPGIHMQSWNGSTEKYSELKPSFQRKYDMDSSTRLAAKKK